MYQIKQFPEDFIVKEISNIVAENNGMYAYYNLKKINLTTIDALQILSKKFKIPLKYFGFAGNKDKNAITEQKISILKGSKNFENIKFKNVELKYLGNGIKPISLGDLEGNEFTITIRNLSETEINKIKRFQKRQLKVPNLYGPQRFSKNNHLIGKAIVKRDFKKAVHLILENKGVIEDEIRGYLYNNKNNYVGALRLIPLKLRKLYTHSYQSCLFNSTIKEYTSNNAKITKNLKIPLIGFNFELNSIKDKQLQKIIKNILEKENLNPRDFIISQVPELASEGGFRDLFFEVKDLQILEVGNDELNKNKQKTKIKFALPKSCYATVALEFLFQ